MATDNRLNPTDFGLIEELIEAESRLTLVDDILPAGMTQAEISCLRQAFELYERCNDQTDRMARKTSVRLLGYIGITSVCVGDFISAGSARKELIEECGLRGFMSARKIGKEMKIQESF